MANVSIVTNVGLGLVTELLAASNIKYVAWGIGTTEAAATGAGSALVSAGAEARTAGTQTQEDTGGTTDDTYQVVGLITCATAAKAITEVVIMDAATDGDTFMRANFSAVNLEVGDSIQFTIQNTINQA
jgi:hypothetical protein